MDIKKLDRKALKAFFVKNAIPKEGDFKALIDGMINQKDDGIVKLPDEPLSLQADGSATSQKKVINFYGNFTDPKPAWTLSLNPRVDPNDPATARPGWNIADADGNSRLFIDQNTGNVGIGTLDPKAKLDVKGIAKVESAWGVSTDPDSGMSHGGSLLIKSWAPQIDFIDTDYHDWAIHVNSGKMHFIREPWEIALVLDDNGRVGIGTRDPAGKLNIHLGNPQGWDGNMPAIRLTSPDARYYLDMNAYIVAGGNVGYQFSPVAHGTANAGLIIDTFGNVGIGTTSPGNLLEIKNSGGTTPGVVIGNGTGRYQLGVGIVTANDGKFGIYDFKGSSNRFVIDTNGNVGIGTANPSYKLSISLQNQGDGILLDSGSNGKAVALFTNNTQGAWNGLTQPGDHLLLWKGQAIDDPGAGLVIAPWRNSASGIRIDANGNVVVDGKIKADSILSKPELFTFKVEGDVNKYYPIVFRDDGWDDGPMILEITRPNVHTDKDWFGSLSSKFTCHSTRFGHGADFIRAEIYCNKQQFIAGYKNIDRDRKLVVWLRGQTTYQWRANQFVVLEDQAATEKTVTEENLPIKDAVDSYVQCNGINFDKNLTVTGDLTVGGRGSGSCIKVRHINGKDYLSDNDDALFLNWNTGKTVVIGRPEMRAELSVYGNIEASTLTVKGDVGTGTLRAKAMRVTHHVANVKTGVGLSAGSWLDFPELVVSFQLGGDADVNVFYGIAICGLAPFIGTPVGDLRTRLNLDGHELPETRCATGQSDFMAVSSVWVGTLASGSHTFKVEYFAEKPMWLQLGDGEKGTLMVTVYGVG